VASGIDIPLAAAAASHQVAADEALMRARLRSLEQLMPSATAGEVLARKDQPLVTISPHTTARAALREMEERDIAFLPVLAGERLVASGTVVVRVLSVRDLMGSLLERHERLLRRLHDERVTLLFPYSSNY
jgi:CBS domain-containing protein